MSDLPTKCFICKLPISKEEVKEGIAIYVKKPTRNPDFSFDLSFLTPMPFKDSEVTLIVHTKHPGVL